MNGFSDFGIKKFPADVMAGFFFVKEAILTHAETFEKSSEKIGKPPGLIPRPSESQVRLYYSVERGGSLEGQ